MFNKKNATGPEVPLCLVLLLTTNTPQMSKNPNLCMSDQSQWEDIRNWCLPSANFRLNVVTKVVFIWLNLISYTQINHYWNIHEYLNWTAKKRLFNIYWLVEPAWTNHLLEETTKHCDDDLDIILRGAWKITFSCIFGIPKKQLKDVWKFIMGI